MSFGTISFPHLLSTSLLPPYKQLFLPHHFRSPDSSETVSQNKPLLCVSIWMWNVLHRLKCLNIYFSASGAVLETLNCLDMGLSSQIQDCRSGAWRLTPPLRLYALVRTITRNWETFATLSPRVMPFSQWQTVAIQTVSPNKSPLNITGGGNNCILDHGNSFYLRKN